jgi:hypothetical protein
MRFGLELLAFTDGDVWRPGIGDPTVMGWITVLGYLVCAVLCFRQFRRVGGRPANRGLLVFWAVLTGALVLLGINKQLDLQTWLTLSGRRLAVEQGWYDHRRLVQMIFVAAIALAGFASFWLMWRIARAHGRELWLPLAGFVLLVCFVVVRAASFHHVDQLINFQIAGVRMNWVFELSAIGIIMLGAWQPAARRTPFKPGRGAVTA